MAVRTYYIGNTYVDNGNNVTGLTRTQIAPQSLSTVLGTNGAGHSTAVGASRELNAGSLTSPYSAPLNFASHSGSSVATADTLTGKFEAGTWTFVLGAEWVPPAAPDSMQWHARVRFYRTNSLDSIGGAYQSHAVEIGSGFNGSVATSGFQQVGYSMVTATLPEFTMNNEHLVAFIGVYLDVAPVTVTPGALAYWGDQNTYLRTTNFINTAPDETCVPSFIRRCPERYTYFSPSGREYPLDVPGQRYVTSAEGEGLPPINYLTQRGPFQHGATLTDFFLQPRVVQLAIRHNFVSRDAYHAGRQGLVGVLNPGLQLTEDAREVGTLRKQLTDGSLRDLHANIVQGPNFQPRSGGWDEWSFTEMLRFQAFDPIWYNPTTRTATFAGQGSQLRFPITFPITFTTIDSTLSIDYVGTWYAYPTITITGPAVGVQIENQTTGDIIKLTYLLAAGRTMTVSLMPGAKNVTLDDGTSLLAYVTTDSDLASWHLTPNNDGINVLRAYATGVSSASAISLAWQDAYLGV